MAAAGRAGLWRTPSARPRGDRVAWEEEERVDEGYEEEHEAEHKGEHEAEQLRSDEEAAAEQEGAYLEPEPEPEPEPGFHLQRGALHLSAATKTEREVANVFRIIAEQLRGHRTLYGHVMSEPADLFRLIDKDGSESLDYNEFKEALRRMDIGLTLRQIREIVAAVDTDANGTIEFGAHPTTQAEPIVTLHRQ